MSAGAAPTPQHRGDSTTPADADSPASPSRARYARPGPDSWAMLGLVLVVCWSLRGLWEFGWWQCHEFEKPLLRVAAVAAELRAGNLRVEWLSQFNGGYGSPFFLFYAPGIYFIAALAHLAGLGVPEALKFPLLLARIVGVLSVYALARRRFGVLGGVVAGLGYALVPYQNANVFVRGAVAEAFAMNLMPLALLCADRAAAVGRPLGRAIPMLVAGGFATAAVIASHTISGLLLAGALVGWGVFAGLARARTGATLRVWTVLGLGIVLSAWYWVPAMFLKGETHIASMVSGEYTWDKWTWMARPRNLFILTRETLPEKQPPTLQELIFAPGDWQLLATLAAALALAVRGTNGRLRSPERQTPAPGDLASPRGARHAARAQRIVAWGAIAMGLGAVALFLLSPWPPFARIPLIPYVQFPFRFWTIGSIGLSLGAGALALFLPRRPRWLSAAILGLCLAAVSGSYYTSGLRELYYRTRATPQRWTPEVLARAIANNYTTGNELNEYLPRQVPMDSRHVWRIARAVAILEADDGTTTALAIAGTGAAGERHRIIVNAVRPSNVQFLSYWFPGWRARVNGVEVDVNPSREGLVEVAVPAGEHRVELFYAGTRAQRVGEAVSALGLAGCLVAVGGYAWTRKRRELNR